MTSASTPVERSPQRRRARQLLLAGSLVFAVAVVEIGLRTMAVSEQIEVADNQRGWALNPGASGWASDESFAWSSINRAGFRDREHPTTPPPNTLRVAVLGDSFMEGANVSLDKTFPARLEAQLAGCAGAAGRQVEVLNFGVAGYGTAQELLTYRQHASTYTPDVVVLAVFTENDIHDNHGAFEKGPRPYFVFHGSELELDPSFRRQVEVHEEPHPVLWRHRLREGLARRSRVFRLMVDAYAAGRGFFVRQPQLPDTNVEQSRRESLENNIYRTPATAEFGEAWKVTEGLLIEFSREVAAHGSEFWVVTLSNAAQVDPLVANRRALEQTLGVDSLFYPDRRIRDFANTHGIRVITLAESMADYAASHGVYLNGGYRKTFPYGTGHWNETGYGLAASIVGAELCSNSPALSGSRP